MWFLTLLEAFSSTTQAKDLLEFIRGGKVINKYTDDNFKQALKAFLKYEFKTKQINLIKKEFNKININKNISKTLQNNKNTLKRDYLKALGIPNKIEQIHFKYFDEWDNEILIVVD
ncbi:hypothetical protein [Mesoplasma melaleucae]|uniref:Uncharacterized protein n=1 Tax=Mesoplasma melaleucae TaxID=81459 RepID=A0A2K8NW55_9MOLU|nr:hypothetical protein [Mesoplasma melaleucae]ATZ17786.1 hypothetical protein EMELA_v1c02130 [Mesoplasma melaleucae]